MSSYFKHPAHNPFIIFNDWFEKAQTTEGIMARAMSVASVNYLGQPSVRMMMLDKVYNQSFVFFTNMESRKAIEILDNPNVSLCFYWPNNKQQVRIEGTAFKTANELSDLAFANRPLDHQINILASSQSRLLHDMSILEQKTANIAMMQDEDALQRPAYWSGFSVTPNRIEFWEEKPFWMHERLVYTDYQGEWSYSRLYP